MRTTAGSRCLRWLMGTSVLLSACGPERPVTLCEYWVLPAVAVEAVDAGTGAALTATAAGIVREGSYTDSLQWCSTGKYPGTRCGALERPGTYEVEVRHQGYSPWTTRGVVVTMGSCHVNTVILTAKLSRLQ